MMSFRLLLQSLLWQEELRQSQRNSIRPGHNRQVRLAVFHTSHCNRELAMAQLVLAGCTVNQCIFYSAVMCLLGKNNNNNGLYAGNRPVNAGRSVAWKRLASSADPPYHWQAIRIKHLRLTHLTTVIQPAFSAELVRIRKVGLLPFTKWSPKIIWLWSTLNPLLQTVLTVIPSDTLLNLVWRICFHKTPQCPVEIRQIHVQRSVLAGRHVYFGDLHRPQYRYCRFCGCARRNDITRI